MAAQKGKPRWSSFNLLSTWSKVTNLVYLPRLSGQRNQLKEFSELKSLLFMVKFITCCAVAAAVLTATGQSTTFRPPSKKLTPLKQSPKICHRWLCQRLLPQYQIRCKSVYPYGGFWANAWNITQFILLCIYTLFFGTHLQGRPVCEFSRWMAQTTWTRTGMHLCKG